MEQCEGRQGFTCALLICGQGFFTYNHHYLCQDGKWKGLFSFQGRFTVSWVSLSASKLPSVPLPVEKQRVSPGIQTHHSAGPLVQRLAGLQ